MTQENHGITTKQWKDAGRPFEQWLRYAQASAETQKKVEELFARTYPHLIK